VDPGKSAGLGFQTRSLHEALALLALVSSKRYVCFAHMSWKGF